MADWDEEKHPRDGDGKFASKGGSETGGERGDGEDKKPERRKTSLERFRAIVERRAAERKEAEKKRVAEEAEKRYNENVRRAREYVEKRKAERAKKQDAEKKKDFVLNDRESQEVYDNIDRGNLYDVEELTKLPTVRKMEEKIAEYKEKYGVTADNNSSERKRLREEWKHRFLQGKGAETMPPSGVPLRKEYKATVVVGLPAAGKSSRIVNPLSDEQGAFILDSDEMKKLIPEYAETNGGAADAVHKESKNLMNEAFAEFTNGAMKGTNIVIPVIGDEASRINRQYLKGLFNAGYDVEIAYKSATSKESANRVIKRAIQTGRFIPMHIVQGYDDDKVRKAYKEILAADYGGKKVRKSKRSEL